VIEAAQSAPVVEAAPVKKKRAYTRKPKPI
jgi:hypothetical protein